MSKTWITSFLNKLKTAKMTTFEFEAIATFVFLASLVKEFVIDEIVAWFVRNLVAKYIYPHAWPLELKYALKRKDGPENGLDMKACTERYMYLF